MSKIIDERGKKYNFLTVIDRAQNDASGRAQWLCQCDCSKMVIVKGSSLRNGKTKSCGCYQKLRTSEATTKNLIGQTIGNFIVLESIVGTKNGQRHKWRCKCNLCGNDNTYITTDNLRKQESCGCLIESKGSRKIKTILEKNNISFIQEKRFADLRFEDTGHQARFDFYVNDEYIIEYDGRQHFIQGNGVYDNEEKFIKTREHDRIKNEYCDQHNIPIIRIPYTELDNITLEMLQPETSKYLRTAGLPIS